MNNWIYLILLLASGCISKSDYNVEEFQRQLDRIEVYSDSTLELVATIYPEDEYIYQRFYDHQRDEVWMFITKNGENIFGVKLIRGLGDGSIEIDNAPESMRFPDDIHVNSISENKSLVFIYKGDCTYIMDRSHLLGEPWMYVNNEEYNGNVLFGDQVYFCFKPLE